jgi:tagatose-1,6-bisphosphate aldolase non-catalytic subunit AgaZ/GatZ
MGGFTPAAFRRPPYLGIGPMSKNCVNAMIYVAYESDVPIMAIPSRRQVDSELLGGGYVEGWSSQELSAYVRSQDPDYLVMLCRDHGGPWQGAAEQRPDLGEAEACAQCMRSFEADIDAGFDLLHIDTSNEGAAEAPYDSALRRLADLYERCVELARQRNRPVRFEIGVETQSADVGEPDRFRSQVVDMLGLLQARGLPRPVFIVTQTGTKVQETRNVGRLTDEKQIANALDQIVVLAEICHEHGTLLKAHNCDYLPAHLVRKCFQAGVDAINIAPELGVIETRGLLQIMDELEMGSAKDEFLATAYESKKWLKWLARDSRASDYEKAIIGGHYIFSKPETQEFMRRVNYELLRRNRPSLQAELQGVISQTIMRYVWAYPPNRESSDHRRTQHR